MVSKAVDVKSFTAETLDRVGQLKVRYGLDAITPHLEACRELLAETDTIDVGVFGRFKAGKSSFLNCLADRLILPVGVTPVTAVITRIRYGPSETASVEYLDGRVTRVAPDSIAEYVAESENPSNRKKVASVTIDLPELHALKGLQFVDTPGLDSVFQHNTDEAMAWLPKVGLALVTIAVDPPLSRQDVELIRRLRNFTPRLAIMVTKADLVSDSDRDEVTGFIRQELGREFGVAFEVLGFSTRPAYEPLRTRFEETIFRPLMDNRLNTHSEIVQFKFSALIEQAGIYLSLALAAAERADADRLALGTQILDELTSFDSIRSELTTLGRESAGQTRPRIMKRINELRPGIEAKITRELASRLSAYRGNLWKTSRVFEGWVSELIACELEAVSRAEGACFCAPLNQAQAAFFRAVQGFRDRLAGNIERALGMRFKVERFEPGVGTPGSPLISIGNLFMFNIDLLWFIIPMSIFRPWFERRLLRRVAWEVEKNLSRIASQWTESVNRCIKQIETQAIVSVKEQIDTVEAMLSGTLSDVNEIKEAIEYLAVSQK
jgi:GTP-binding protein EngB required for normal cell division